jgi:hypothetical protein
MWQGDISTDAKAPRVQDTCVRGIRPDFGWWERSGGESWLLRSGRSWKRRDWPAR